MNDNAIGIRNETYGGSLSTINCMKVFVFVGLAFKSLFFIFNVFVLAFTYGQDVRVPLKLFISVYTFLLFIQGILFFLKHRDFFTENRIPDFSESNNLNFLRSLVGAFTLFWYLTGLHWLQDCHYCNVQTPLLYYTSCGIVYVGLIKMFAPLLALVVLVILVSYLSPKVPEVDFDQRKMKEDDSKCTICLEKYQEPTKLKILPCNHHFHSSCIDDWFEVEETCPLCMKHLNPFHEILEQTPV